MADHRQARLMSNEIIFIAKYVPRYNEFSRNYLPLSGESEEGVGLRKVSVLIII